MTLKVLSFSPQTVRKHVKEDRQIISVTSSLNLSMSYDCFKVIILVGHSLMTELNRNEKRFTTSKFCVILFPSNLLF